MTRKEWNSILGGVPTRTLDEVWAALKGEELTTFKSSMASMMQINAEEEIYQEPEQLYEEEQKAPQPAPTKAGVFDIEEDFGKSTPKATPGAPAL